MKINFKKSKAFSVVSKDTNKIHINKSFARKYFVKEPIVHGAYLVIFALSEFLKRQKHEIIVTSASLNFKNFVTINEDFSLKIFKDKIIIYNDFHTKLEIYLKYKKTKKKVYLKAKNKKKNFLIYNFDKLVNFELIQQLVYSSYYIGTIKPGNGSLILNIKLNFSKLYSSNIKPYVEKKIKKFYVISYQSNFFKIQITACKLVPFKKKIEKLRFNPKTLEKLKGKKILIFGPNSDLAARLNDSLFNKNNCKTYKFSFRININKPRISFDQKKILKKKISIIKPNYVFYFSSPKIYFDENKGKKLFFYYKVIFKDYLETIIKFIRKNKTQSKIFYPSTIFLNNKKKYKRYKSYLSSKQLAEKICKSKKNRDFIKCVRLPKLISRSNYNLLGYYEGQNIDVLDKYLENFF
tara:strand:+ start:109 stop:1332 length:1224 start_codon:yes stop_codon:yes gene_type:complete